MNKNTAIVQLAVPVGLTDQELFEAIRGALARGLPHDAKLKDVVLQDAFVLDQGESVEIVPAAAGEKRKGEEVMLYSNTEAFSRAEAIVRFRLHPPTPHRVASWWIKLYPSTNTLVCWVLTSDGLETPFSDVIGEEDARYILQGLEEETPA